MPWYRSAGWARWMCRAWSPRTTLLSGVVGSAAEEDNTHASFVLREAAVAVERYRAEGKAVLLHCVRAEPHTPTVAALYGARVAGISAVEALAHLQQVLPRARPNPPFMRLLRDNKVPAVRS